MQLSARNAQALLIAINQDIEEYADATVKNIIDDKNFDNLFYPPNNGLTDAEKAALTQLGNNKDLKNALRKILADNAAGVVFSVLNVLDGTSSPKNEPDDWTGVKLIDEDYDEDDEPFEDMLHDGLLEAYWKWRELRGDKGWKLDTQED